MGDEVIVVSAHRRLAGHGDGVPDVGIAERRAVDNDILDHGPVGQGIRGSEARSQRNGDRRPGIAA